MALRWIGLLIGSVGAASLGCTVDHRSAQGHTLEGEIIAKPKHYNCHRADRPVVVDGRLNDSSWEQAPWTDEFVDIQGDQHPTPRFKTRAKMLWDDDYLYVGAVLEEPHVWGTLTDRDAVIYADNDFEVFIDPDGDARDYYEIEVNALNTVFDLLLDKPYRRGGKATITWDLAGLQSGVHVDGTLNDFSGRDAGWSVELALPWSSLAEHARKPVPPRHGDQWRVNFSRVQWQHTVDGGHYQKRPGIAEDNWVWSVQGAIDMHIPEHWGYVEFMSGKAERSVAGVTVDERQTATDSSSRRVWPAKAAGQPQDCATLEFEILGDDGLPMPGRLTFIGEEGAGADLFPNTQVMPEELAIRSNVIYTRSGRGSVTVPPGKYNIYASRGLEWSIAGRELELRAGRRHQFTARLRREVDTSGWICGDFHLHTLTYSGHGDSNMTERVITFLGEGLEFVVATDHNHHTDYHPILRKLGVEDRLTAVTGNEVSVPIGHFNAFPLEPNRPIPPKDSDNAGTLFKLLRAEPNRYDVVPVIQLNHPRWSGIDYFGKAELDPLTGVSNSAIYGEDFDSVEVFNENEGWGYYDAEAVGQVDTGSNRHWVLRDWFNLLNRGHRYAAVGNSDSHTVYSTLAGYPRNYVISSTDDPGQIDVAEVTRAIRNKQLFATIGPFVEYWVDGRRTGEDVMASNGSIDLRIKVQAASWIDCDRVKVVVNGDVVREIAVPSTRNPLRLDTTIALPVPRDGWLVLLIEGDDSLAPIVHDKARPILPLAVTNPVWIDGNGDGRWTAPWAQAQSLVQQIPDEASLRAAFADRLPYERALVVLAAGQARHSAAAGLIRSGLTDRARAVRLVAGRAAEFLEDPMLADSLVRSYAKEHSDPYGKVAVLRALRSCAPDEFVKFAFQFVDESDPAVVQRYAGEVLVGVPSTVVEEWRVVGYFPRPSREALVTGAYGPEEDSAEDRTFVGKMGTTVRWEVRRAEGGYLDLLRLDRGKLLASNAIAYAATHLYSPEDRQVRFAMGSDDGCRLWVNGKLVHEDHARHRATPFQYVGRLPLRKGWNRVLCKVENGRGSFGLYLQVLDKDVRTSVNPTN